MSIEEATQVTEELVEAFAVAGPQLSSSNPAPSWQEVAEMVSSPATVVFVARDEARGGEIVGSLTLAIFRIPTGVRGLDRGRGGG